MTSEEQDAINELKAMSREELDLVDYGLKKWLCQCKGCTNGSKVRDYGISPWFYWAKKGEGWLDLTVNYLLCYKHNKLYKRLLKNYDREKVQRKLLDLTNPIDRLIDIKFTKSNKIEKHAKSDKGKFF